MEQLASKELKSFIKLIVINHTLAEWPGDKKELWAVVASAMLAKYSQPTPQKSTPREVCHVVKQ